MSSAPYSGTLHTNLPCSHKSNSSVVRLINMDVRTEYVFLRKSIPIAEVRQRTGGIVPGQGWQAYGTRGQNGTLKGFLVTRSSLLSIICILCRICVYVYTYISERAQPVHELALLLNNTASETFLHKSGAVRIVDWIFINGVLAWRWLGKYVTLYKTFYNLLLE
jgi:hypothetical protein